MFDETYYIIVHFYKKEVYVADYIFNDNKKAGT